MSEQRTGFGRRSEDGHCDSHERHSNSIVSFKTERKVMAGVSMVVMALIAYIYNANSTIICSELKEIKEFMIMSRENDTLMAGKLNNIEWRLQLLEGRK